MISSDIAAIKIQISAKPPFWMRYGQADLQCDSMAVPQDGGDVRGNKKDKELCDYIKEHTGLVVDAYFLCKIKWVLENVPEQESLPMPGSCFFRNRKERGLYGI